MSSILNPIKLAAALLAGSALLAWHPAADAQSCSTAAWTSVAGNAIAGAATSDPEVRRYSGRCGLMGTIPGTGYVVESTSHSNEGDTAPLRVRFFVFPQVSSGSVTIFQGMDANTGGNAVVQVHYNAGSQRFEFQTPSGTGFTSGTAPASRWYRVELVYQRNTALSASVRGNGGTTLAVSNAPNAGPGVVNAVRLGAVAGSNGTVFVDEYEASRSASGGPGVFTTVVRGDATGDGQCNSSDITAIARDFLFTELGPGGSRQLAAGQADCNEDGEINSSDITCIARRIINFDLNDIPCD
jgi:hypothetical protein